jgi:hypothetical protein
LQIFASYIHMFELLLRESGKLLFTNKNVNSVKQNHSSNKTKYTTNKVSLSRLCQCKVVSRECPGLVNIEFIKLLKKTRYLLLADFPQLFEFVKYKFSSPVQKSLNQGSEVSLSDINTRSHGRSDGRKDN